MRILFTGASSLTGMWFAKELIHAGHTVVAVFRSPQDSYEGLRKQRIDQLLNRCFPIFDCPFGSDNFLKAAGQRWDLFCHHAADVKDYKSPDFDVNGALASNTKNLKAVMQQLQEHGCRKILLTGSVFEPHEGAGSDNLRAFSPYGLSKGLTAEVFRYYASLFNMRLGKVVIPNPFGPYEEPRFTTYLIQNWMQGKTAVVATPDYIRDNIPVSLLAKAYVRFAESLKSEEGYEKCCPSYYVESQGAFTRRFAEEMRERLMLSCEYQLKTQLIFSEPKTRINTEGLNVQQLGWNERKAWDELALFYQQTYQGCLQA